MRPTFGALILLLVPGGCADRTLMADGDALNVGTEGVPGFTFDPTEAVASSGDPPRAATTSNEGPPESRPEPAHTSSGAVLSTSSETSGIEASSLGTTTTSSSSTSGSGVETTFDVPESTTGDAVGSSSEGGTNPWIGDTLQIPDLPLPQPPEPGCARVQWLPRWATIAALSADGSAVVGTFESTPPHHRHQRSSGVADLSPSGHAFLWRDGGFESLGAGTVGVGVDDTGSTMLVQVSGSDEAQPSAAALWQPPAEPVALLPDVTAVALSGDGTTIVGNRLEAEVINENRTVWGHHALRWSEANGIELAPFARRFEDQESVGQTWWAQAANGDASVVVGARSSILYQCIICPSPQSIFWDGPGIHYASESQQVTAVSRDGTSAVGYTSIYPRPHRALRWDLGLDVMEELDLEGLEIDRRTDRYDDGGTGEYSTYATDVSSNGAWVLAETVLWRVDDSPIPITNLLAESCIAADEWIPDAVWYGVRIAVEGRALVGCARRDGEDLCWVATNMTFDASPGP